MNLLLFGWNWVDITTNTAHYVLFHIVKARSNLSFLVFGHAHAIFHCLVQFHRLNMLD